MILFYLYLLLAEAVERREHAHQAIAGAEDGPGANQAAGGRFRSKKKIVVQQRVLTIEQLQRDRTGGQELLDQIASTVSRTENLWLIDLTRKGNNLSMNGASASVNSVANFITALKRSGYFQKVEIKETKQDDKNTGIQTFLFQISAEISPPAPGIAPNAAREAKPARAPEATGATSSGSGEERVSDHGESISRHVVIMQGLLALAITVGAGGGGNVSCRFARGAGARRSRQSRAVARGAESGSHPTAGVPAALRRTEVADGCAFQKQLDTLKTIVPEEKEIDEFIRQVQGAATASNVQLRRLTSQPSSRRNITTRCRSKSRRTVRTSTFWTFSEG